MFKKRMLLGMLSALCLSLAVPSVALATEEIALDKALSVKFSLKEPPVDLSLVLTKANDFNVIDFVYSPAVEIFDYGGSILKQVNSNKLTYKESNVFTANFAKEQNKNFERMRLTS